MLKPSFLRFFVFSIFVCQITIAQTFFSGKVITEDNQALEGASVYFNNTTIGAISKQDGSFKLKANEGNYTLIVSFLGYKTQQIPITLAKENKYLDIKLMEDATALDEVVVKKVIFDNDWKYNLSRFKKTLFGKSKLADDCVILNDKVLRFDFDYKTKTLTAYNIKPLKIKHKSLGYLIYYDIVEYSLTNKYLFFSGYLRYENLQKNIKPKWIKNRLKAFNGSRMHFLRSLTNKKLTEDGFLVSQFKRIPNKKRPPQEEIKKARTLIREIYKSKKQDQERFKLDSAKLIVKQARKPKFIDAVYQTKVPYKDMILFDTIPTLDFDNYLLVTYTKEPEEENYLIKNFGKRRKATGVQSSNIILKQRKAIIDPSGIMVNPNALINEGYWAFESFANMLPLDYKPPKK